MARRRPPVVHGLLVVDKPAGVTSHDVVAQIRRRFGERRVGHAGTLDPDATGVLVVALGRATRLLRFVGGTAKRYTAEVVLGIETDTLDASGTVTAEYPMGDIAVETAQQAIDAHLMGPIMQTPPMVSAIRVDGRRLHELAREGLEVERAARPVVVHEFTVTGHPEPRVLSIEVCCSAGTYVRSLAADLGTALGGGAHLRNLRRTAVGSFTEQMARPPDEAELLPVVEAVRDLPRITVDPQVASAVRHGRVLERWDGEGPWAVTDGDGELLAVYESVDASRAKPAVVVAPDS